MWRQLGALLALLFTDGLVTGVGRLLSLGRLLDNGRSLLLVLRGSVLLFGLRAGLEVLVGAVFVLLDRLSLIEALALTEGVLEGRLESRVLVI